MDLSSKSDHYSILCLNLENRLIDAHDLFRLLGRLEMERSEHPLIVKNIHNDTCMKLKQTSDKYYKAMVTEKPDTPYWSSGKATVFYNFVEVGAQYFYFTDIFWGSTKEQFNNINYLVSRTNFNSLYDDGEKRIDTNSPDDNSLFINHNVLLPFDILLEGYNKTLFEHNAGVLLRNEIQANEQ